MTELDFAWDDGGRREAFPDWPAKAGDCVVRAIAIMTGVSYEEAYKCMGKGQKLLERDRVSRTRSAGYRVRSRKCLTTGRPADHGVNRTVYGPYLQSLGYASIEMPAGRRGWTARDAFRIFGDCILRSKGTHGRHCVAIKNGKLRDTWNGLAGDRKIRYCTVWVPRSRIDAQSGTVQRHVDPDYKDRAVPGEVHVMPTVSYSEKQRRLRQIEELQAKIAALQS